MNYIRTIVSGKKKRYIDGQYNLDLTYVTPRIIAMAFPGSGIKTLYRNHITEVAQFLSEKHNEHYWVLNLSGIKYDNTKFNNNVIDYDDWPDHHSPPLPLLFTLIEKIHSFLKEDISNVIVVNCNAGKGRTGTWICCYLLFSGRFSIPEDAFDYYSLKRFNKGLGVTHASQKRYVKYFFEIIQNKNNYNFPWLRKLTKISFTLPPYETWNSIAPMYEIYVNNKQQCTHTNINNTTEFVILPNSKNPLGISEKGWNVELYGDILMKFSYKGEGIGRIAFNTAFIKGDSHEWKFPLVEIDPYKFSINPKVNSNYEIILTIEKKCPCDNAKKDLCEKCQSTITPFLEEFSAMNKVAELYSGDDKEGKILLFGNCKEDIDIVLSKRNLLEHPMIDRSQEEFCEEEQDNSNSRCIII